MLSKEEMISGLQDLILDRESFINEDDKDNIFIKDKVILESVINYINQLESDKQKLIEELELEIEADKEDLKYNNLSDYGRGCLDEAQEILKILKGENDE